MLGSLTPLNLEGEYNIMQSEWDIFGLLKTLILSMCGHFGIKEWEGQRCTWVLSAACGRWWFTPPFSPALPPPFTLQWRIADTWSALPVHGQHFLICQTHLGLTPFARALALLMKNL